jgi:prepilin-type N-terminal cleavage/methylation domain-containing protein/prepilin-type processing-associated H-X9-DG protein
MRQYFDISAHRTESLPGISNNITPRGARGFTLIEMLVVMGIIGVLTALISAAAVHARDSARAAACMNNLKSLGGALTTCLTENNGYFPAAYYEVTGSSGEYVMVLKTLPGSQPDVLFQYAHPDSLVCRNDRSPASILARTETGDAAMLPTSYAYNVSLPLLYRNASRVAEPMNTVTFYEGNAQGVVGSWQYAEGWADSTVSYRHSKEAKFLFLDGHVESAGRVPEVAFSGGQKWVASGFSSAPAATGTPPEPQHGAFSLIVRESDGTLLAGIPVQSWLNQSGSAWHSLGVTDGNGRVSATLDEGQWQFSVHVFGGWFSSSWYTLPPDKSLTATVSISFSIP